MCGVPPPKLAAWLGLPASDPGGPSVVVVVGPANVVVDLNASSRTASESNTPCVRSAGSPKVRPPSVEVATKGRMIKAFGATAFGNCRRNVT